jgi:hypothetical protein
MGDLWKGWTDQILKAAHVILSINLTSPLFYFLKPKAPQKTGPVTP